MIQPVVQKTDSIVCKPKPFSGTKTGGRNYRNSDLQAAETKYNLACLWAATVQLENKQLKQELANSSAQAAYCRACFK